MGVWGLEAPSRESVLRTTGVQGRALTLLSSFHPAAHYALGAMRNFSRYQSALTPSRQLIFLPSA
jgi:hypothetical protein